MGLTSYENWFIIKSRLLFGVSERHRNKYSEVNKGDLFIFYIIKKKKIGGILFKVTDKKEIDGKEIFGISEFSKGLILKPLKEIQPLKINETIIQHLSFIKNKSHWGGSLMGKAIIEVSKKDFKILAEFES